MIRAAESTQQERGRVRAIWDERACALPGLVYTAHVELQQYIRTNSTDESAEFEARKYYEQNARWRHGEREGAWSTLRDANEGQKLARVSPVDTSAETDTAVNLFFVASRSHHAGETRRVCRNL